MNTALQLRLRVSRHSITIEAAGQLTALTAHLLPKVVTGTLRRYATPVLKIDLSDVRAIDYVGDIALQDCEYETRRRGILLTITRPQPAGPNGHQLPQPRPARRAPWVRALTRTGTVCRSRLTAL